MCFPSAKAQPVYAQVPTPPPTPMRADEENRAAVDSSLEEARRRRGILATNLTGGLGDAAYGKNVQRPSVTALGAA